MALTPALRPAANGVKVPVPFVPVIGITCIYSKLWSEFDLALPGASSIPEWVIEACTIERSCEKDFPFLVTCEEVKAAGYRCVSEAQLLEQLRRSARVPIKRGAKRSATSGPCAINSGVEPGTHLKVVTAGGVNPRTGKGDKGGEPVAAIVCCDCCDDSSGEPERKNKCAIKNQRPQYFN